MASWGWPWKVTRGCLGKTKHATVGIAQAAARALEAKDAREGKPAVAVTWYPCPRCRAWHVGHTGFKKLR